MKNDNFKQRVELNQKIVETWPKWKQKILITSQTILSGKFILDEQDLEESL